MVGASVCPYEAGLGAVLILEPPPTQRCGLTHTIEDEDVVQIVKKKTDLGALGCPPCAAGSPLMLHRRGRAAGDDARFKSRPPLPV